ncbi:MAG: late competence development ComFB family protein [Eubacteriales bacterium]|nr:late competence development ComFB family protein [Eubacteriales bacterium]
MSLPWETHDGNPVIVKDNVRSALIDCRHNVVNVTEIIAEEKVGEVISMMDACSCPTCVYDILALALNSLPTRYVTTDVGKQYIQLNSYKKQFETDVVAALIKACQIVKESPRHTI